MHTLKPTITRGLALATTQLLTQRKAACISSLRPQLPHVLAAQGLNSYTSSLRPYALIVSDHNHSHLLNRKKKEIRTRTRTDTHPLLRTTPFFSSSFFVRTPPNLTHTLTCDARTQTVKTQLLVALPVDGAIVNNWYEAK